MGLVSAALGTSVNVRPAKVLAGADPIRTNALLQSVARAAASSNPSASRAAEAAARESLAVAAAGPGGLGGGGGNDGEGRSKRRTGKGGPAPMPSPGVAASPVLAPRDKRSRRPRPGQSSDVGEVGGVLGDLAEHDPRTSGGAENTRHSNSDSRKSGAMGSVEGGGEVDFLRRGHLPSSRDRQRNSAETESSYPGGGDFYKPKLGASADGPVAGSSSSSSNNGHVRESAVDASPGPNEFGKRGRSRALDANNNNNNFGALPDFGVRDGSHPNKTSNNGSNTGGSSGSSSLFPTLTRPSGPASNPVGSAHGPPPTTVGPTGELLQPMSGNDATERALMAQKMAAAFLDSEDDETSPRTARRGGSGGAANTAATDTASSNSNNQPVDLFGARAEERLRVISRGSERRGGNKNRDGGANSAAVESTPGSSAPDATVNPLDSKGLEAPSGGGQKKLTGLVDAPVPIFSPPMHPVERNAPALAKPDSLYDFSSQPPRPGGGKGGGGPPPNRPGTAGKGKGKGKGGKGRHGPGGGKGGWMTSSSRPATTTTGSHKKTQDSDSDDDDDDGGAKKRNGSHNGGLKGFYSPAGGLPAGSNSGSSGTSMQQQHAPPPTLLVSGENDGGHSHNDSIGSMGQHPSFRSSGPNGSHLRKKYSFNDPTPPPGKPSPPQQQQQQHRHSYFHDDAKHSEATSQARQPRDPSIRPPGLTPTHAERVAAEAKAVRVQV